VQYNASIMQPMIRNAGEALGVSAPVNLHQEGPDLFDSKVAVRDIYEMEQLLAGDDPFSGDAPGFKGLRAPSWPEDLLGKIDTEKRERGRKLYTQICQGCHLPPVNAENGRFWNTTYWTTPNAVGERYLKVEAIPIEEIGTDPAQAEVLTTRKITLPAFLEIRDFEPTPAPFRGTVYCATGKGERVSETSFGVALAGVVEKTVNTWYDRNGVSPGPERDRINGYRPNCIQAGIWATAPFLHTGAVPTLWDMLGPPEQRPARFCLGSRQFDPVKVGYSTECIPGSFELDTSIPGNLNTGHEFRDGPLGKGVVGRALTDEERWDLIEFLKSL
jgi:mono/diheme cytochrome c family protein